MSDTESSLGAAIDAAIDARIESKLAERREGEASTPEPSSTAPEAAETSESDDTP